MGEHGAEREAEEVSERRQSDTKLLFRRVMIVCLEKAVVALDDCASVAKLDKNFSKPVALKLADAVSNIIDALGDLRQDIEGGNGEVH